MSDENKVKELHGIKIDSGGHTHAIEHLSHLDPHELHQLARDVDNSHEHHGLFMVSHGDEKFHYALKKDENGVYKIHEAPKY